MRKAILPVALTGVLALGALAGCSSQDSVKQVKLDVNNPTSITVWHYYNGAQQAAFNQLVSEFNATVGKEKGIYVEGWSQGSVTDLEKAVTDSANGAVGSKDLPDVFSAYSDTAYSIQKQDKLVDLTQYVSQNELGEYVDSYVKEGHITGDDALYLFPVAKSTEVAMMNKTDWDEFAKATNTSTDELSTAEGITKVAQRYYEWTDAKTPNVANDGKAFYGRDSMSNYFIIGMKQMGTDLFSVNDGKVTINADKDKIRRLWDNYYVPYVKGYFASAGKFRSDDVKTGEILAYTGSSPSAMYFPDKVFTDDGSHDIDYEVLPTPVVEGGQDVVVQQGAGMAVTKSDEAHEYASCEFLKWFTEKENNLRFVTESSYLPVRKDANSTEALDEVIKDNDLTMSDKARDSFAAVVDGFDSKTFYTPQCFDTSFATRKVLDYNLSDKAVADRAAVEKALKKGATLEEATKSYVSDAAFDAWYKDFSAALNKAADGESK